MVDDAIPEKTSKKIIFVSQKKKLLLLPNNIGNCDGFRSLVRIINDFPVLNFEICYNSLVV